MSFTPSRNAGNFKKNLWIEFTALAAKYAKANIGQGFYDGPFPTFLAKILRDVAEHPEKTEWHQYTSGFGHSRLVIFFFFFFKCFIDLNIFEPAFDSYVPQIKMAGGVPVVVLLELSGNPTHSSEYRFDPQILESKITPRTKMIILNNPHNPTGKLFTRDELEIIASVAKKHNLIVVSDEVYEWHVYGHSKKMIRFASLPGMFDRTVTIGSAGKAFSVTGWKIGWALAPEILLRPLKSVHQDFVYTCCTPVQEALARAFEQELELFDSKPENSYLLKIMADDLLLKRDRMAKLLQSVGIKPV
ncbi:unnamed protein product, partial [Enterobius vermicularis]|uniref:Aminotran_1_2 domain-containing protein n=1 Tax=Enterobius vermicularis TaxID=51028 RepID=A0A0N4VPF8_ENTVE